MPRTKTPKTTKCLKRIHRPPRAAAGSRCSVSMQSKESPSLWMRKESLTGHWWVPFMRIFELWRETWIPMGTLWSKRRRQRIGSSNASGKVRHGCLYKNPPLCVAFISFAILSTCSPKLCDIPPPFEDCLSCELALMTLHFRGCCILYEPDDVHVDTRLCTRTSSRSR
jgi:hypothetical protein